jgi:site-specific DNA recombinase
MIAAIYARKSTVQNVADDVKSVSRQIDEAKEFAERNGWSVVEEYVFVDDGVSGAEFERRPELVRLLKALKPKPPFQVLLINDRDRLGREQIETSYVLKLLIRAGVRVFETKGTDGREISFGSSTDKMLMTVENLTAEIEREKNRERTYGALVRKAKRGLVVGGKLFGYTNIRTSEGVKRVVNESQAEVIRRIFTLYADGVGLGTIAKTLNADGVPGPRGPWNFTALRETIRNETYHGVVVWNRSRKRDDWGVKKASRKNVAEWVRIEAPEVQIVDEALWQRVQRRIVENGEVYARGAGGKLIARPSRSDWDSPYLLSGFVRCGVCGGPVIVSTQRSGAAKKTFLRCAKRWKGGPTVCSNKMTVRAELLDRAVFAALTEALKEEAVAVVIEGALAHIREAGDTSGRLAVIEADLEAAARRERNLGEAVAEGGTPEVLISLLKREQARRKALEAERAALAERGRLAGLTAGDATRGLAGRMADLRGLLEGESVPKVRQLIRALGASFTVNPEATPDGRRGIRLVSKGSYEKLGDVVLDMVAPTGFEPVFQP